MGRFGRFGVAKIGLALLFALATGFAFAAAVSIKDTKHNFAYTGVATGIKAQSTQGPYASEICVFCHTPHFAQTVQKLPLWNKELTTAAYTTYTSDYLTSLGYPTAEPFKPGQKSRLCLSCHDGTVALGSVYNVKGTAAAGALTMAKDGTTLSPQTMPTGDTNLGINLADDHPVGYLYQPGSGAGQDPELKALPIDPIALKVKLYPDPVTPAKEKVECISCHDPHDDQYKKFLLKSNVNGALCKVCHNKTNYATSGHDTSTQTYNQLSDTQGRTTVKQYSCLACHRPHTGQGVPLLRGVEEVTCYQKGCHGNDTTWTDGATTPATATTLNIKPEMIKAHAHPTTTKSGMHKDIFGGESPTQLGDTGTVNRHGECFDCHNPHQVQPAVEKLNRGALRISAALKGMWGVEPSWNNPDPRTLAFSGNAVMFATPATFTKVNPATDEYQVCMKCHSNYVTLPISGLGSRNIAAEINPYNSSYHGIVPGDGQTSGVTNYYVNQNTMVQPWAGPNAFTAAQAETERNRAVGSKLVYARGRVWCSDCHNSNLTTMPPNGTKTQPSGPHGSDVNNTEFTTPKVPGPAVAGTTNADRMLVATIASTTAGTPLCLTCHRTGVYWVKGTAPNSPASSRNSTEHGDATHQFVQGCFTCHMFDDKANTDTPNATNMIYPHGMNRKWAASGAMTDSFNAGAYYNIVYGAAGSNSCYTSTTTLAACNAHNPKTY